MKAKFLYSVAFLQLQIVSCRHRDSSVNSISNPVPPKIDCRYAVNERRSSVVDCIESVIRENSDAINSVEKFLVWSGAAKDSLSDVKGLREFALRRASFAYFSRSTQGASWEKPRVILSSEETSSFLAAVTHPSQLGSENIEIIAFNWQTKKFDFARIGIVAAGERVEFERNPTSCTSCHTSELRPNWETYPFWPGFYGSAQSYYREKDTIFARSVRPPFSQKEERNWHRFLKERDSTRIYRSIDSEIIPSDMRTEPYSGGSLFQLTRNLYYLNNLRIRQQLIDSGFREKNEQGELKIVADAVAFEKEVYYGNKREILSDFLASVDREIDKHLAPKTDGNHVSERTLLPGFKKHLENWHKSTAISLPQKPIVFVPQGRDAVGVELIGNYPFLEWLERGTFKIIGGIKSKSLPYFMKLHWAVEQDKLRRAEFMGLPNPRPSLLGQLNPLHFIGLLYYEMQGVDTSTWSMTPWWGPISKVSEAWRVRDIRKGVNTERPILYAAPSHFASPNEDGFRVDLRTWPVN